MLPSILALGTALAAADECREELALRFVVPEAGATDVPRDLRVGASFIGWGQIENIRGTVQLDGEPLSAEMETWCYEHEGPHEVHCWWAARPTEPLEAHTEYTVHVEVLGDDGEPWVEIVNSFRTGDALALEPPDAPTFSIRDAWYEQGEGPCAYGVARRYTLDIHGGDPAEDGMTLLHVYELMGDGSERLVHTILTTDEQGDEGTPEHKLRDDHDNPPDTGGGDEHGIKQFVDGLQSRTDCFRVFAENAAGVPGASTTACFGADDTAVPHEEGDSAESRDSAEAEADTSGADAPSESPSSEESSGESAEGCGSTQGAALAFWAVVMAAVRRGGEPTPRQREGARR